jgi:hypothetical protein
MPLKHSSVHKHNKLIEIYCHVFYFLPYLCGFDNVKASYEFFVLLVAQKPKITCCIVGSSYCYLMAGSTQGDLSSLASSTLIQPSTAIIRGFLSIRMDSVMI